MHPRRIRLAVLSASLLVAAGAQLRTQPPAPVAADAPDDVFSAARAHAVLTDLLGDQTPHPVGSAANDAVRERLLAQLRRLGLEPEEQHAFVCNGWGSCANVTNVIAWLPGQVPGPTLALTSHYDSVGAGPGAADDGHGVALVLETLRILRNTPRHSPLVAIFTDGEEAGLLGARAFTEHPRAAEIGVAINVEARGTTGVASMFETSDGNAALLAAYATGPRPSALSLSYEIYRRLPNDTDLTVFKDRGLQGMNFAFIGGVQRYHTPRDDLAHLDLGSVQHQGDAVLATAQALLSAPLPPPAEHNAHYADLLAAVLLRWPGWLDLPLAAAALLALVVTALRRRRELSARRLLLALTSPLLALLAAAIAAVAVHWLIEALTGPLGPWPASAPWAVLALASAASAAAIAVLRPLARRAGPLAQSLGVWLLWTVLALALALTLPGASILFLAPAAIAAIAPASRLAPAIAAVLAVALWAPLAPALTDALGLDAALVGVAVGWLWTALAPTCSEEHGEKTMFFCACSFVLVTILAGTIAGLAPRVDFDHPAKANLIHLTDLDAGRAWHVVEAPDGLPEELRDALAWDPAAALLPWSSRPVPSAPAALHSDAGPTLTPSPGATAAPTGRAIMTLKARPGALAALLVIPDRAVSSLTIGGRPLDPRSMRPGPSDTRIAMIFAPPAGGLEIVADLVTPAPWTIVDVVPGLAADAPASARPDTAVPFQWGDLIAATRTVIPVAAP